MKSRHQSRFAQSIPGLRRMVFPKTTLFLVIAIAAWTTIRLWPNADRQPRLRLANLDGCPDHLYPARPQ